MDCTYFMDINSYLNKKIVHMTIVVQINLPHNGYCANVRNSFYIKSFNGKNENT